MADQVRAARVELIQAGLLSESPPDSVVPDLIVRSWRRSLSSSVNSADPCQRFSEIDTDSVLRRAADPVLDRWQNHLADTGTTLFLSDRAGSIVARRTSDGSARRRLDNANAAEGFDYSEDSVGTNGLGTSMVERRPVLITGSQHYNDALATLACAAAPVYLPSGSVIGSVSLGGPIETANPLMLSLTREIGQQIEERLRSSSRPEDLALAMSFMRFTNSQRPTVIMDRESLLANNPGLPYIDVTSHVMLWELLSAHDWSSGSTLRLQPDGTTVEVMARRVIDGPRAHYVLHFADLGEAASDQSLAGRRDLRRGAIPVGVSRSGTRVLVVDGPAGSGRATVAEDLRAGRNDLREFVIAPQHEPPWMLVGELLTGGTDVLVRRAEHLPPTAGAAVGDLLQAHLSGEQRTGTLLITASLESCCDEVRAALEPHEPAAHTEPLQSTPERIPALVKRILERDDPAGRHTLSPAALQSLMRWTWPGNITELCETLHDLVKGVSASVIERRHLPGHLQQSGPRRSLTLIEAAEREAIIKALNAASGNKSEAAALLGIGRTTLYRRLRQLGLEQGEDSL
jgi:sigma-54 dependent transcriptional regulator, acetoin dehydrogenase operon transcriptional activator AcoR